MGSTQMVEDLVRCGGGCGSWPRSSRVVCEECFVALPHEEQVELIWRMDRQLAADRADLADLVGASR